MGHDSTRVPLLVPPTSLGSTRQERSSPMSLSGFVFIAVVGTLLSARCAGAVIILRRRGKRFLAPADPRLIAELGALLLFAGVISIAVPSLVNPASIALINNDNPDPWWADIAAMWVSAVLCVAGIAIIGLSEWVRARIRRSAPEGKHARRRVSG